MPAVIAADQSIHMVRVNSILLRCREKVWTPLAIKRLEWALLDTSASFPDKVMRGIVSTVQYFCAPDFQILCSVPMPAAEVKTTAKHPY